MPKSISQPIETMSREEVQDELRNRKIDVARAVSKVQQAVAASRDRTALEEARAKRPGIIMAGKTVELPEIEDA